MSYGINFFGDEVPTAKVLSSLRKELNEGLDNPQNWQITILMPGEGILSSQGKFTNDGREVKFPGFRKGQTLPFTAVSPIGMVGPTETNKQWPTFVVK